MGASQQGIILADSLPGYNQLARWTSSGPDWLHPRGHPGEQIAGQAPDISADGKITYLLPPHDRQGTTDSKNFTIWLRRLSDGSPEHIIYQHKTFPGVPFFGPDGQVAVIGPVGKPSAGQHPGRVLGIWSPRHPHDVTTVSSINKGFEVGQLTWLGKPARI